MNSNDFIAVFDSGVGGISVLRHLVRLMPKERYLYFGDSANAPYGTKTKAQVKALTFAAAERLMQRGIKALVVACNTATAAANPAATASQRLFITSTPPRKAVLSFALPAFFMLIISQYFFDASLFCI